MAFHSRLMFFDWEDRQEYCENHIMKLLKSNEPKDKEKLNSMIERAVDGDDEDSLEYLLNKGYKIGQINGSKQTFLHYAFYRGRYGILSSGMKFWVPHITEEVVNTVDSNGLTILHVACHAHGSKPFIEKCLEYDADVNAHFGSDPDQQQRDGFTPLHFAAVNFEGSNWMKLLVDHNADVNAKDCRGRTPLHIACRVFEDPDEEIFGGYVERIKILLDGSAEINEKDDEGNTPLLSLFPECYDVFTVIQYNVYTVPVEEIIMKLKLLLERGADVTLTNESGETILHLIIKSLESVRCPHECATPTNNFHDNDHLEMIRQIFTSCPDFDVNVKNCRGQTPLQLAIFYLSADIVQILLDHNIDDLERFQNRIFDLLVSHRLSDAVPRIEEVVKFFGIIEMFTNKNLEIDSEQNLDMLAYLIHENCEGKCGSFKTKDEYFLSTNLMDVVNFGSSSHLQSVYERLTAELSSNSAADFQTFMVNLVIDNLKFRMYANFYIDSMFPLNFTSSEELNIPVTDELLVKLKIELDHMKSTKMRESVSLYDVMTMHPHSIYKFLTDVDFSSVVQDYLLYKDIIKGHLSKSLVRHYVEKSAFVSLKDLLPPSCPSLCCKQIMEYLTNEDILNVCRAVPNEY